MQLELTNAVWGQRGFAFRQAYLDTLAKYYGAGLRLSDFEHQAEAERVRINAYVAQQTKGRIKDLLPPGILDDLTRMVLVNTITFTADWRTPFPKASTEAAAFTRLDGTSVQVPMMRVRGGLGLEHAVADDYAAASLPYAGGASMLVVVPNAGKFAQVQAGLSANLLRQIDAALAPGDLIVRLPKFTFTSHASLRPTLEALGMHDAFDASSADLSGIDGRKDLYLKDVVHQATIHVDENGTTAAAATGAVVELQSAPPQVSADRPFLYLIRDDATGAILFAGQVLDPTVTSVG